MGTFAHGGEAAVGLRCQVPLVGMTHGVAAAAHHIKHGRFVVQLQPVLQELNLVLTMQGSQIVA